MVMAKMARWAAAAVAVIAAGWVGVSAAPSSYTALDRQHPFLAWSHGWGKGDVVDGESQPLFETRVSHPSYPDHSLRLTRQSGQEGVASGNFTSLCDPGVKQVVGYLDVADGKHLWFWFFESRDSPANDPLVLWLNGGPGCSSTTGLLFENGPCTIQADGYSTKLNPYSWNSKANVIFLDSPANVGYSYGDSVSTTPAAAVDKYAFLQLFLSHFSEYSTLPFHITGESYAGHYIPNDAHLIFEENQKLKEAGLHLDLVAQSTMAKRYINLDSIAIGNGLTDPLVQFENVLTYACAPSPYAVYDESTCARLKSSSEPRCTRLVKACYDNPGRLTCLPANLLCWSGLYGPYQDLGLNPYDVTRTCSRDEDGPLCYRELEWIESFMNNKTHKEALGVDSSKQFESCNMEINRAFAFQGDGMKNSAGLVPALLEGGVRVLIYAGERDFMCNYVGNKAWVTKLDTPLSKALAKEKDQEWYLSSKKLFITKDSNLPSKSGKDSHGNRPTSDSPAGYYRTVGGGKSRAGQLAYLSVPGAGHMVPYDQPQVALHMINGWLQDLAWDKW